MTNPDLSAVSAALQALGSKQVRILTGTVSGTSTNAQTIPVRLDNEGSDNNIVPVVIPSVIGLIEVGARVSIITVPPAGMIIIGIIGADFNIQALWDYQVLVTNNTVWMDRQLYLANDTWNKPTSPLFLGVQVMLQAGGGGSGGTTQTAVAPGSTTSSAGGQGGGYLEVLVLAASLTSTVAVTVGAGGAGGSTPAGAGGTGGASSFGAYGSIPGGDGGSGAGETTGGQTTSSGGTGVQASTVGGGAILLDYRQGDDGGTGTRYQGGGTAGFIVPGFGGGARMGGITKVQTRSAGQIAPSAGWAFGGGASGRAADGTSIAAGTGSAGAQGIVIVKEIYRT